MYKINKNKVRRKESRGSNPIRIEKNPIGIKKNPISIGSETDAYRNVVGTVS